MTRQWIPTLAFVLLLTCVAPPSAAEPQPATHAIHAGFASRLGEILQTVVREWLDWLHPSDSSDQQRATKAGEAPRLPMPTENLETGWIDKEGCSLDPWGKPILPCTGG